jgi:hypothetical protein
MSAVMDVGDDGVGCVNVGCSLTFISWLVLCFGFLFFHPAA